MRDLVIRTIERNFAAGLRTLGRELCYANYPTDPVIITLLEIQGGNHRLLVPWLKSLSNEQLLGVLESQHCERYR